MKRANGIRGQAFVEWVLLVPLFGVLFMAIFAFGQWFVIHQQLLIAAKQGAFLYSSGRLPENHVRRIVQRSLLRGYPSLKVHSRHIFIGKSQASQAKRFRLDQVTIRYEPRNLMLRFFLRRPMEESCVIKHAPGYWKSFGLQVNPPVAW